MAVRKYSPSSSAKPWSPDPTPRYTGVWSIAYFRQQLLKAFFDYCQFGSVDVRQK